MDTRVYLTNVTNFILNSLCDLIEEEEEVLEKENARFR